MTTLGAAGAIIPVTVIVILPFVYAYGTARVLAAVFLGRLPRGLLSRAVPLGGLAYLGANLAADAISGEAFDRLEGDVAFYACLVTVALTMRRYVRAPDVADLFD